MIFVKKLSQLSKKDVASAGGKGASLGEMTRLFGGRTRFNPVPPGFVVLAGAFDRFLAETDLDVEIAAELKKVKIKDMNSVERASTKIHGFILDAEFPKNLSKEILSKFAKLKTPLVAVRSSATTEDSSTASWAGELESYLNTNENKLLMNVKKCWASLFTPRAITYRLEKKLDKKAISVAVVVQAMIQSEISGITFTVHPVTEDRNQMVIEAGWGLGEAIVGGRITPDTYIVKKSQITKHKAQTNHKSQNTKPKQIILDKNISAQKMMIVGGSRGTIKRVVLKSRQNIQKLTDKQIIELAGICRKIEIHYGKPQDIEWAFASGKFYIVQSRPITTLK